MYQYDEHVRWQSSTNKTRRNDVFIPISTVLTMLSSIYIHLRLWSECTFLSVILATCSSFCNILLDVFSHRFLNRFVVLPIGTFVLKSLFIFFFFCFARAIALFVCVYNKLLWPFLFPFCRHFLTIYSTAIDEQFSKGDNSKRYLSWWISARIFLHSLHFLFCSVLFFLNLLLNLYGAMVYVFVNDNIFCFIEIMPGVISIWTIFF